MSAIPALANAAPRAMDAGHCADDERRNAVLQNITCDVEEIDASYVNEAMVSSLHFPRRSQRDVIALHVVRGVASANAMYLGHS